MQGINLLSLLWIALGLFAIGLIVLFITKFLKKDNALAVIQRYLQEGNFKKALSLAQKYVNEKPDDFVVKFYIAQAYEGLKDYPAAVQFYEKASVAAANSNQDVIKERIFLKVADLYKKLKKPNESLGYYVLVLEKDPRNPRALLSASEILFETKNYRKAKEYLDNLIKSKPDNLRGRYLLARVDAYLSLYSDASAHLEAILKTPKVNDDILLTNSTLLLADVYINMKNYQKAIQTLKLLLDNKEEFENALVKIIEIHIKLGQLREAQDLANRNMGRVSKENECALLYLIATAYQKDGDIYKAAKTWESAYKISPSYRDLKNLVSRYAYLIQHPLLEPLFGKSEANFETFCSKLLKNTYIKQTIKRDAFWALESGDKSYVIYRRPFPISTNELTEVEKVINQNFRANTQYTLYSLYGVTNENNTSDSNYNSDKMDLVSDHDLIRLVEETQQ